MPLSFILVAGKLMLNPHILWAIIRLQVSILIWQTEGQELCIMDLKSCQITVEQYYDWPINPSWELELSE